MVRSFKVINPANVKDGLISTEHNDGVRISDLHPDLSTEPWLCVAYISGKRYFPLRHEWDETILNHGDCVYFMPHVGDPVSLLFLTVVATVSVIAALAVLTPPTVGDAASPDPVYSNKGQKNQIRLGSPIEDCYGYVRMWPSYATRAYNQYYGNDQYQFQLFCLGQGSYDIEEIRIEDTEISNFEEIEYEIYAPGELVTLFPDNVETSVEVGGIELLGPNETDETVVDDIIEHSGPFVANAVNTTTTHLELDIIFPQGLYSQNDDGGFNNSTVTALFEYRLADSDDDYQTLLDFEKTLATNTPQRFTVQIDVPEGRYEVRAIRVNDASDSSRVADSVQWAGMRAFLTSTRDYGDVTMLAVRARATNNLNDNSSNAINVVGTRMLPIYDPVTNTLADPSDTTQRAVNRSHIWAMVNILRAEYGGALVDKYLDLEHLASEAAQADVDGIYFDWIFDQRTTVWEASKLCCFVAKSIPMLNGSRVSVVRDQPASLPTFFINPENTVENSFSLEKKLFELQDYDGLEIEYTDPDTWKAETVECLLGDSTGSNMKRQTLSGVADRQRAYDLGMYLWSRETYERSQVNVTTGLEGYIPTYGDLGRIGSDIPRWGQSGYIENIVGNVVTLSNNVEFTAGETHQLAIRGKLGQDLGPYTVTAGDTANQLLIVGAIDSDNIYFDYNTEPPYYLFGVSNNVGTICRIVKLTPNDNDEVALVAIVDDQRRFTDYGTAPEIGDTSTAPVIPDAPIVESIEVIAISNSIDYVTVSWSPALGASSYVLEQSSDGVNWSQVDTVIRTNYTLQITPGILFVRVAGVNLGLGAFVVWSGEVGQVTAIPESVTGLTIQPSFTGTTANLKWSATQQATSYVVTVLTDSIIRCVETVATLSYDFTIDEAIECGGLSRTIEFQVKAVNNLGESTEPATLTATNPTPAAVTGLTSVLKDDFGTYKIYTLSWSIMVGSDISRYKVFGSDVSGFTPDASTLKFEGLASSVEIRIDDIGQGFPPLFWVVAALDVWGDDFNPSAEAQI